MGLDLGLGTLFGGIVSGIGSLFGSHSGSNASLKAVQETNKANRDLAERAFEYNTEMWERQNDYNTPLNQMQRLRDAGLNPNLMYGQGDVGNASNYPKYDAPTMSAYTGFGDFGASQAGNQLMAGLSGYAQIKKTQAETDAIRQNTQNMQIQGEGFALRNAYQAFLNNMASDKADVYKDLLRTQIASYDSTAVNNYAGADLKRAQTDLTRIQSSYTESQMQRFDMLTPLVYQQVETTLKQSLFDLYQLSPAKLEGILSENAIKKVTERIAELNATALFNELEFGEKSVSWNLYKRDYDSTMMELEKEIKKTLLRNGINLKGSNWFTPLLYNIEQQIALPIEQLLK